MKNLQAIACACMEELDAIGIPYVKPREITVNTRAKSRWGQCRRVSKTEFTINISERILRDEVSDAATKNTVIHELLHTVDGCQNHGPKWKSLAAKVNRAYPKYNIQTSTSAQEKGIEPVIEYVNYKYKVGCETCGTFKLYTRKGKVVSNVAHYQCGRCGGKLYVKDA